MSWLLRGLALACCLALLLALSVALGHAPSGGARGLEALNITVYPQWLRLVQARAGGAGFEFEFESTAPEPMSLQDVAAQLECTACRLDGVTLSIRVGGAPVQAPVEVSGNASQVLAAARGVKLALGGGQRATVSLGYTPVVGAAALAARVLNVSCTLTMDGYRVHSLARLLVNTSLSASARGRGAQLEITARVAVRGNESLRLALSEQDPLLLCIEGAAIESAAVEGGGGYAASVRGSCAAVTGQGGVPAALNLTLRAAVGRQGTVVARVVVSLRAGNATLASRELRVEAGKVVTLQRLYGLPYVYAVATPEPLNATVTLRVGEGTREVQLVNGRAVLLLPEALWPILTPLRLEAEKVVTGNPPAIFYAVQEQEEVVVPGLATLAALAAAAAAAALAHLRRRRKPRIEDYIEEFVLE
jgi:hypothetical protein